MCERLGGRKHERLHQNFVPIGQRVSDCGSAAKISWQPKKLRQSIGCVGGIRARSMIEAADKTNRQLGL
jgi:hypothetical protein